MLLPWLVLLTSSSLVAVHSADQPGMPTGAAPDPISCYQCQYLSVDGGKINAASVVTEVCVDLVNVLRLYPTARCVTDGLDNTCHMIVNRSANGQLNDVIVMLF